MALIRRNTDDFVENESLKEQLLDSRSKYSISLIQKMLEILTSSLDEINRSNIDNKESLSNALIGVVKMINDLNVKSDFNITSIAKNISDQNTSIISLIDIKK